MGKPMNSAISQLKTFTRAVNSSSCFEELEVKLDIAAVGSARLSIPEYEKLYAENCSIIVKHMSEFWCIGRKFNVRQALERLADPFFYESYGITRFALPYSMAICKIDTDRGQSSSERISLYAICPDGQDAVTSFSADLGRAYAFGIDIGHEMLIEAVSNLSRKVFKRFMTHGC